MSCEDNTVERAVILCLGEQVTAHELPIHLLPEGIKIPDTQTTVSGPTLRDMEREFIRTTLLQTGGNKSKAAKLLGIARQTLLNKINEYKLWTNLLEPVTKLQGDTINIALTLNEKSNNSRYPKQIDLYNLIKMSDKVISF